MAFHLGLLLHQPLGVGEGRGSAAESPAVVSHYHVEPRERAVRACPAGGTAAENARSGVYAAQRSSVRWISETEAGRVRLCGLIAFDDLVVRGIGFRGIDFRRFEFEFVLFIEHFGERG